MLRGGNSFRGLIAIMFKSTDLKKASLISSIALAAAAYSLPAAAQSDSSASLEEIVVTAQRREQALVDIPMSVTAVSGELLQRQQADNFQDLTILVPSFSITGSTRGVTRLTLRGINSGGVASTIGTYVGDTPFGSSSGLANAAILSGDFDTYDLSRIEVLRGPQGTLYGASSLSGVMKYIPNPVTLDEVYGAVQGTYETVDGGGPGYAFTGYLNVPLNDQWGFRVTGFYRSDDGFIDSIGNNPIPSLTDPNIFVNDGTMVVEDINKLDTFGGRVQLLFQPSDTFSMNIMALLQDINSDSSDTVDADPVTLEPLYNTLAQSTYHPRWTDIQYRLYSATLDWDLASSSLLSVTSYSTFEQDFQSDLDPLYAALFTFVLGDPVTNPLGAIQEQTTATDKFTQEFRWVSHDNDTFEWLVGLYYAKEESAIDPQIFYAVEANTEIIVPFPTLASGVIDSEYEEVALYADGTWYLSPKWELEVGGRLSQNDQTASQVLDGILVGGLTEFQNAKSSESPFTWSFAPRFIINDTSSTYLRIATGFRPGGPNLLPPGAPTDTPTDYDSDTLTSYELGYKMASEDGRMTLDLAAYYQDWEDIQLFVRINDVGLNANGGGAVSKGFEFATSYLLADGLTLSINGAYTDAYLTEDTDPLLVGGFDGDPLPYVPEWAFGLSGDYEWSLGANDSTAYVGGTIGYTGERTSSFNNRDANDNIIEVPSYTTVNLRGGVDFGMWNVEIFGKNITNEYGSNSYGGASNLPNGAVSIGLIRPATWGLLVGVKF